MCQSRSSFSASATECFGMGVHGLTTYINQHSAALARTLHLATDVVPDEPTTFVVDAWS